MARSLPGALVGAFLAALTTVSTIATAAEAPSPAKPGLGAPHGSPAAKAGDDALGTRRYEDY